MDHGMKRPMGFVETVQFRVKEFIANMNITSSDVIKIASCFGIGFITGLILKRYLKYIVTFILLAVLFVAILQYFELIVINQGKVKSLLGLQIHETYDSLMNLFLAFFKKHLIEFGSGMLGCLLGFKVG